MEDWKIVFVDLMSLQYVKANIGTRYWSELSWRRDIIINQKHNIIVNSSRIISELDNTAKTTGAFSFWFELLPSTYTENQG